MRKLQLCLVLHSRQLPEEIGNRKLGQETKVTDFTFQYGYRLLGAL